LAHVESFHQPLVVVPNIDGPANHYIVFKERSMWKEDFAKWLARDYEKFPDFEDDVDIEDFLNGKWQLLKQLPVTLSFVYIL
jgi:hypothetical protein